MKKLIILIIGLVILFSQSETFATPSLGVASYTGEYLYKEGDAPPTGDKWIQYFNHPTLVPSGSELEGFVIGPSGSDLAVFTSYNPSVYDIYLLANTGPNNLPITFGGADLNSSNIGGYIGQVDGYLQDNTYYGLQLSDDINDWLEVNDTNYFETTYYIYKRPITYANGYDQEDYFFAMADTNGTDGLQFGSGKKDDFSPKTSSTCDEKIPEPTTLSLVGMGILGVFGWLRRKV